MSVRSRIYLGSLPIILALLTSLNIKHGSSALLKFGLALVEEDAAELHSLFLALSIH